MSDPSPQALERKRAAEDLEDIERLKRFAPFQRYFHRRILSERDRIQERILSEGKLEDGELHDLRVAHRTLSGIAKMMGQDEAACRNILAAGEQETDEDESNPEE